MFISLSVALERPDYSYPGRFSLAVLGAVAAPLGAIVSAVRIAFSILVAVAFPAPELHEHGRWGRARHAEIQDCGKWNDSACWFKYGVTLSASVRVAIKSALEDLLNIRAHGRPSLLRCGG
jgi:hypothetical protein